MPRDLGFSGLGLSFRITPSLTTAITEHLFGHSSHVVATSRRSPRETAFRLRNEHESDDAIAPAPATPDVAFKNRRRSIAAPVEDVSRYLPQVSGCSESAAWLTRYVWTSNS